LARCDAAAGLMCAISARCSITRGRCRIRHATSRNSARSQARASVAACVRALDRDIAPAKFDGTMGRARRPVGIAKADMKEAAN
jgi:hypothetical protein